jgi:hypothetical protein
VGIVLVAAIGASGPWAGAAGRQDPRQEREEVRRRQASVAAQVDGLRADQDDVEAALDVLDANVASQTAALRDAERAASEAAAAADQARAEAAAAEQALVDLEVRVRELAVEAYMRPGGDDIAALSTADMTEAVQRQALIDFRAGQNADAVDQLRAAREDLQLKRDAAEAASARADEQRAAVAGRLGELESARAQQAKLASQVASRVEAALAEAANLAGLDASLSRQIEEEQRRLAARVASARSSGTRFSGTGNITIVNVGGIYVNAIIADDVAALLAASEDAGLDLGGGGYRDPEDQWRLRQQNCPDPANSPPSACSPPTARPGQSMHEQGLAIDFTCSGVLITSRTNSCYRWLDAHAATYGLYELSSGAEPWHWSTNGN